MSGHILGSNNHSKKKKKPLEGWFGSLLGGLVWACCLTVFLFFVF